MALWRDPVQYRRTEEWRAKNNFGIFVVILTIVLLVIFA